MTKEKVITFSCYIAEAIFGTIAVATIMEQTHPYWAILFAALAKGSAAAKSFLTEKQA